MNIFLLCAAILVIFYAALSANVSRTRRQQRAHPGANDVAELTKAIRSHGNAAEYVPLFVAIFLYLSSIQAGHFAATIAVIATLSRLFHAAGMLVVSNVAERHPFRFWGALGTYICLFALGGVVLMRSF